MAKITDYSTLSKREKINRYFSEDIKKRVVSELEQNLSTVAEICRDYEVSRTAVYKWLYKYSKLRKKGVKQIVEKQSDTNKLKALKEEIKELQRVIGEKQLTIDFQSKVIDLAEEEYKVDIKKKFGEKPYSGTGTIEKNTPTK